MPDDPSSPSMPDGRDGTRGASSSMTRLVGWLRSARGRGTGRRRAPAGRPASGAGTGTGAAEVGRVGRHADAQLRDAVGWSDTHAPGGRGGLRSLDIPRPEHAPRPSIADAPVPDAAQRFHAAVWVVLEIQGGLLAALLLFLLWERAGARMGTLLVGLLVLTTLGGNRWGKLRRLLLLLLPLHLAMYGLDLPPLWA